ncbi:MAG TPA: GrpB family protein [Chloroflexota bacterium]|nr:GrpB family protein [Chloroflexota bacterium]
MPAEPIVVVHYDPAWPVWFREAAARFRAVLGGVAVRIDHIGSTAVPGLAAKPVLDVQISVAAFEPLAAYRDPLEGLGYVYRAENTERTKRYFREPPGSQRTHVHVRRWGSWSEQFALLFRDYLRVHPAAAGRYAALKLELAQRYRHDRSGYVAAKEPFIWATMREADAWAQATGWTPGASDA